MLRRISPILFFMLVVAATSSAQDPFDDAFKAPAKSKEAPKDLPPVPPKGDAPRGLSPTTKAIVELIDLKAKVDPIKVRRGGVITVVIDGTSKPYAYTYSASKKHRDQSGPATKLEYRNAAWLKPLFPIRESEPELKVSSVGDSFILHDRFHWKHDLLVAADAPVGQHRLQVMVKLQVCTKKTKDNDKEGCLPSDYFPPLEVVLDVLDGTPLSPPPDVITRASAPAVTQYPLESQPDVLSGDGGAVNLNDLGGLLVAAFAGALLMLLTPCVFPMIPITVNFFIKQSEKEHHRPFYLASVYALTIVILLSVVILLVGRYVIDLANDPWFNWGLGLVLALFALGLFGMFEVDLTKFFGTVLVVVLALGLVTLAETIFPSLPNRVSKLWLATIAVVVAFPLTMLLARITHVFAAVFGFLASTQTPGSRFEGSLRKMEAVLGSESSSVLRFLADQESRGGALGASFMALTFTITSFSCTGPFLGIMLAPVAGAKPPALNLVLAALVYSMTFAAPFFLLALFPAWLKKLPKSGGWMTTIKVTMGFLEIGAALKFLANSDYFWNPGNPRIFNYDTVLVAWIALSLACSAYLFGLFHLDHDTPSDHIGVPRMIFASIFLGMAVYLAPLMFGITPRGLVMENVLAFLPPNLDDHKARPGGSGSSPGHEGLPWITDNYPAAWQQAVAEKKLIFIDFTGVNCANCRLNERNVLSKREVIDELKKYVCVQLFTDSVQKPQLSEDEREQLKQKQIKYQMTLINDLTQPSYVLLDPDPQAAEEGDRPKGRLLGKATGVIPSVDQFVRFLQKPLQERTEQRAGTPSIRIEPSTAVAEDSGSIPSK